MFLYKNFVTFCLTLLNIAVHCIIMNENKNVMIAALLSLIVIIMWKYAVEPMIYPSQFNSEEFNSQDHPESQYHSNIQKHIFDHIDKQEAIKSSDDNRILISSNKVIGSINGSRIDDLTLMNYKKNVDDDQYRVILFSPEGTRDEYFVQFGWEGLSGLKVPDVNSKWESTASKILDGESVDLIWYNEDGVKFMLSFSLDDKYMFKVIHSVSNQSSNSIVLKTLDYVQRIKDDYSDISAILHEGPIGFFDGSNVVEVDYTKVPDRTAYLSNSSDLWSGFSDKYWATIMIPKKRIDAYLQKNVNKYNDDSYYLSFVSDAFSVAPGQTVSSQSYLFAGPKELQLLDYHSKSLGINKFDKVVDFGILYFITKPVLLFLQFLNGFIDNFGVSILILTVLVKFALLPLSIKSQTSMKKMKEIQPQINRIRELYKHDSEIVRSKTLALMSKHKVNPASGCLPMLLQIPVFFSLYKVLSVTIYMRHAPFVLWIKDLSAIDTTNIFNMFGLLDVSLPSFLNIGILPILLGVTMFLQQKLTSSTISDPSQAKAMKFLPLIFVFVFASFPSGLVIYWIWSNILTIIQHYCIKKFVFRD